MERAIYHITHLDNLRGIVDEGRLWCDSERMKRGLPVTNIGLRHIKERRLRRPVSVAAGGCLGDYVPFNFCNRSVMLYTCHRCHDDYDGGQDHIVHLKSSVRKAIALGRPWAFTDRHAELGYAAYHDDSAEFDQVDWSVMDLHYWKEHKEVRQAEFLVHRWFPWSAVDVTGVRTRSMARRVEAVVDPERGDDLDDHGAGRPRIVVEPSWYY